MTLWQQLRQSGIPVKRIKQVGDALKVEYRSNATTEQRAEGDAIAASYDVAQDRVRVLLERLQQIAEQVAEAEGEWTPANNFRLVTLRSDHDSGRQPLPDAAVAAIDAVREWQEQQVSGRWAQLATEIEAGDRVSVSARDFAGVATPPYTLRQVLALAQA